MKNCGRDDDGGVVVSNAELHRGRWRPTLDRPALVALLLGAAGVGYRLVLTLFTLLVVPLITTPLFGEETTKLFQLYVARYDRYNPTYLALASIIVLLTWMYLTCLLLLLGGKLNAILRREGEKLRTTAPVAPEAAAVS